MIGHRAAEAHMRGDCWPPTCVACEIEDGLEIVDDEEDER